MTTALSTRDKVTQLNEYLEGKKNSLIKIAPQGTDVDRIIRVAMFEAVKNERLVNCSPTSIYMALAKACELDLVAGGVLHRASLVPMWDKKSKGYNAELWIEYTGLMDLVKRSGEVAHFKAEVVHDNDEFEHSFDLENGEVLRHKKCHDNPGNLLLAYAVCFFKDGQRQVEVMRRSPESGPWAQHTEEMWRKTVIRRICKYLPLTPKTTAVLQHDIQSDFANSTVVESFETNNVAEQGNAETQNNVIDVQSTESKPKLKPNSKVKDLVEKATANNLPEPEEDFTS